MKAPSCLIVLTAVLSLWAASCRRTFNTFDSPEKVLNILKSGSPEEKARVKEELHIPSAFIQNCENGDATLRDLELRSAVLENGMENAIITAKCGYNFLLIALVREHNGKWSYEDSIPLDATYDNLKLTLHTIVNPLVEDIVVHAHVVGHGTGIYQANFLILKLIDGHLKVILDEVEDSHQDSNGTELPPLAQRSTFDIVPTTAEESAVVEETQTLTVGKKSTVSTRDFYWDSDLNVFQASSWDNSKPVGANHN